MNEHEKEDHLDLLAITEGELAMLGDGEVAYIKQLDRNVAQKLFPALRHAPEGINLFAVVGADGTPLALTDSWDSALANVMQHDLVPVSVH